MNELQKLFTQARTGTLLPDFDRWAISDDTGWTVADVVRRAIDELEQSDLSHTHSSHF